ncbi:ATPase [filamentous cyanobacterium LEGE 11480]|uniref:ATPase n=1 Tax=Romeriopsis navalis LEGE 11480 TaxID=2777977 RepID=A0A928VJJ6_9CYAN|nr:potassium transporter TrkG [Romeriopsis navalis]MBE9028812.1 ATPase [Romeriopsis navalis LEGE 11480]
MTVSRTICLGFLAVILVGTLLFTSPLTIANATSDGATAQMIEASGDFLTSLRIALYTGTSAVCVTGLSLVDVGKYFNLFGQIILILLVQIGGLGYMTATTVILLVLRRRLNLRDKVAIQQSLDATGLSGLSNIVRSIIATTLFFEITGAIFLFGFFLDPTNLPADVSKLPTFIQNGDYTPLKALWLAVFHSVSAFNNAGFSLFADNLGSFTRSGPISLIVTLLFVFGGIGYQAIMEMFMWLKHHLSQQPGRFAFSLNFKVAMMTMLGLLSFGTLGFLLIESQNPATMLPLNGGERLVAAWFQSATTRTAGFNTIDIGNMTTTGLFFTLMMMFIGANPGSTGGGIKTTTFYVLLKTTLAVLKGEERVLSYQRRIPPGLIFKAIAVVVGSGLMVLLSTVLLTLTDAKLAQGNFVGVFFEVVSAFATVGLSQIGSSTFSPAGQFVIIWTMYVGRVGVLMLMGAILGDPKPSFVKYPEENMLVG